MEDAKIYAAWEAIHYALRDVMRGFDDDMLRFLIENAEGNAIVNDVAHDELEAREESAR